MAAGNLEKKSVWKHQLALIWGYTLRAETCKNVFANTRKFLTRKPRNVSKCEGFFVRKLRHFPEGEIQRDGNVKDNETDSDLEFDDLSNFL